MKIKEKKIPIAVRLEESIYNDMVKYCEYHNVTISEYVRYSIQYQNYSNNQIVKD